MDGHCLGTGNHFVPLPTVIFYKNYRSFQFGQCRTSTYLGLVWDTEIAFDENNIGMVIGTIGQNVQLITNALGLGSVVNVDTYFYGYDTYSLSKIGLPSHEIPMLIIPMGYPKNDIIFKKRQDHRGSKRGNTGSPAVNMLLLPISKETGSKPTLPLWR